MPCARKIVMGTAIPPRLGGLMTVGRTCTVCRTREGGSIAPRFLQQASRQPRHLYGRGVQRPRPAGDHAPQRAQRRADVGGGLRRPDRNGAPAEQPRQRGAPAALDRGRRPGHVDERTIAVAKPR